MFISSRSSSSVVICIFQVYSRVSPSEDYFKRTMLGLEEDTTWENVGGLRWQLVLCLAIAWVIVCLCLIKGVQSSGKVVYFTALFPYLVLVILLIRGATLDGAYDGILFYVYPTAEKLEGLLNINVWSAAATQIPRTQFWMSDHPCQPHLREHKGKVVIGASVIGFLMGLTMCTNRGVFMFDLINYYSASFGLLVCAITEVVLVVWVYGHQRFFNNIAEMGIKIPMVLKWYWMAMWKVVTPLVLVFVLIMTIVQYTPASSVSYSQENYTFPPWVQAMGWMMAVLPIVAIILGAFYQTWNRNRNMKLTDVRSMFSPSEKWCSLEQTSAGTKALALENASHQHMGDTNAGFTNDHQGESVSSRDVQRGAFSSAAGRGGAWANIRYTASSI